VNPAEDQRQKSRRGRRHYSRRAPQERQGEDQLNDGKNDRSGLDERTGEHSGGCEEFAKLAGPQDLRARLACSQN